MSFVKYRVKEVATDFGKTPKEIADIISKYSEKPKSNTQVLTEAELNALFDDITRNNQIKSLEQVFAVKPAAPKAEPKAEQPAEQKAKPEQQPKEQKAADPAKKSNRHRRRPNHHRSKPKTDGAPKQSN